jgi:tetratricopeptide (TPR) repeat protein
MNKKIVAVCAAALGLALPGCDERTTPPSAPVNAAAAPAPVSAPLPPPKPESVVVEIPEPVIADVLALAHEDGRNVDHLSRAAALREQGDFDGALTEARRALFDEPGDVPTLEEIARNARRIGAHDIRLEALNRLAAMLPEDPAPLIQQARMHLSLKRFDEALAAGMIAVKRGPEEPEAYQVLGRAHLAKGELAPAIAQFEKVLALKPEHGYALNNLGFAYLRANRNQDAVEVLRRAVEALPYVAYVHNNLGVALERVGRIGEAKGAYEAASFLSPKYVKAQVNASRIARLAPMDILDGGAPESVPETALDVETVSEE